MISDDPNNIQNHLSSQGDVKLERIEYPGVHDVLSGRGGHSMTHPGNLQFRMLIDACKPKYHEANKQGKAQLAADIVTIWRSQDPMGRFLTKTDPLKENSLWHDIGNKAAIKKVSQALREKRSYPMLNLNPQGSQQQQQLQPQQHQLSSSWMQHPGNSNLLQQLASTNTNNIGGATSNNGGALSNQAVPAPGLLSQIVPQSMPAFREYQKEQQQNGALSQYRSFPSNSQDTGPTKDQFSALTEMPGAVPAPLPLVTPENDRSRSPSDDYHVQKGADQGDDEGDYENRLHKTRKLEHKNSSASTQMASNKRKHENPVRSARQQIEKEQKEEGEKEARRDSPPDNQKMPPPPMPSGLSLKGGNERESSTHSNYGHIPLSKLASKVFSEDESNTGKGGGGGGGSSTGNSFMRPKYDSSAANNLMNESVGSFSESSSSDRRWSGQSNKPSDMSQQQEDSTKPIKPMIDKPLEQELSNRNGKK